MREPARSALIAVLLALALPAQAQPSSSPDLARAEKLVLQFQYPAALKALEAAWVAPGNSRERVLRILELEGRVAAFMNKGALARSFFLQLLVLEPQHKFSEAQTPRVMTHYYEAGEWVANKGSLRFERASADQSPDAAATLAVEVTDPLWLGREVRFHVRGARGSWRAERVLLADGRAELSFNEAKASWWAELLGDHEAVLALAGSADWPFTGGAASQRPTTAAVSPAGVGPVAAPAPADEAPRFRPLAYSALGGAAVAFAGGAWFGLQSASTFRELEGAARDGTGSVTGLTQRRAYELNGQAKSTAVLANGLLVGGALLAVIGTTLWWNGSPVAVAATPLGVGISGELP